MNSECLEEKVQNFKFSSSSDPGLDLKSVKPSQPMTFTSDVSDASAPLEVTETDLVGGCLN